MQPFMPVRMLIVTRDPKGFKKSDLPVFNPIELLKVLQIIE